MTVGRSWANGFAAQMQIPYRYTGGGVLDNAIDSWHDFFFAAFDPGGYISVDKPPVALWIGASSVRLFGYSSWSLLLPSAIAGAATVALLWCIVRRRFGVDLEKRFASELERLMEPGGPVDDGLVRVARGGLTVTDLGRLFVRNVA